MSTFIPFIEFNQRACVNLIFAVFLQAIFGLGKIPANET